MKYLQFLIFIAIIIAQLYCLWIFLMELIKGSEEGNQKYTVE